MSTILYLTQYVWNSFILKMIDVYICNKIQFKLTRYELLFAGIGKYEDK